MRLTEVSSPAFLPAFVSSCAATLAEASPPHQFEAGRHCAREAMARLDREFRGAEVPRGASGEPLWPSGITGSITHKKDFVWAAVARTTQARSIGIDVEHAGDPQSARRVEAAVTLPEERFVAPRSLSLPERVALLFSIKESAFKCLYPVVGTRFYYEALAVREIDVASGLFRATLTSRLSAGFDAGRSVHGWFAFEGARVLTATLLPCEDDRPT